MKVGDTKTVSIDGIGVVDATVSKVDGEIVTIDIPATRVEFKVKFVLTDEGPDKVAPATETILTGPAPESIAGATVESAQPTPVATPPAEPQPAPTPREPEVAPAPAPEPAPVVTPEVTSAPAPVETINES